MLAAFLLISMFYVTEQHEYLLEPLPQHDSSKMIRCVTGILDKYFAHKKELTFVNMNSDENDLLKEIHLKLHFSLITRKVTQPMFVPNLGYVVYSPDVDTFSSLFQDLTREPPWNPYARFLIIIELLLETELRQVFDVLLRQRVNDALLVNGTEEGQLYTYNPFDNYACGRYYDTVISYGLCSETTHNLYPNKLVNGLKNCTFRGSHTHIPPYSIEPSQNEYPNKLPGIEQYVLKTVSESDEFKIDFNTHYNSSIFSRVAPNMTATGPIAMLQTNETDVMFGSMMLRNSYARAFTSVIGYDDYVDEFTFAEDNQKLIQCIISVLENYFSEQNELTFVGMQDGNENKLLKTIHTTTNFPLVTRLPDQRMDVPILGYLISAADANDFIKYIQFLISEPAWNPYARFLIVIALLRDADLEIIFDELLRQHVDNVLLVNGTEGAHLYTYNPFDNYACGKYYDNVTSYGQCLLATNNLYPKKLVTGLKNCNFTASLAHQPPFTIDPTKTKHKKLLGTEEYIIKLLGELEHFTVSFNYNYNGGMFTTVALNMTPLSPMKVLQRNEFDIIFGAIIVGTSRAETFTYMCGYHDYSDELRFAVKSSPFVPLSEYVYLEFELDVWGLLVVTFIVYSIIVSLLLRTKDRGEIMLLLLDNLLLHGRHIRIRQSVKCVLIMWVLFAYLINTFYQTNLFSFTTHPSLDFQIADEEDIAYYDLTPCVSLELRKFIISETDTFDDDFFMNKGCQTLGEAMDTVSSNEDVFTLIPNYFYLYNEAKYSDKWGRPLVYYFEKPYMKLLFGFFFYNGFPVTRSLRLNALRLRENGIIDKSLQDHYYNRRLKQKFHKKTFQTQFLIPWHVYIPGTMIATLAFILELLMKHMKLTKLLNYIAVQLSGLEIQIEVPTYSVKVITCVEEIVEKYFAKKKVLTYDGNSLEGRELLKAIHALNVVTVMPKISSGKIIRTHKGYLISTRSLTSFKENISKLYNDSTWNPEARFLIVCASLKHSDLKYFFNYFLELHVTNVVIINATDDAQLYSYNPFENYGCGKNYENIISHRKCSQAYRQNLFPNKYVTGLNNCTFNLAIPHLPPYTVHPKNNSDMPHSLLYGIEPYLLRLIGDKHGFSLNITLDNDDVESFTTVEADRTIQMLQDSKADVVLGGQLLVPSHAADFSYVFDLFPYVDEIRFLVRTAKLMPSWKTFYLEFDMTVWLLIALSLLLYSMVMIFLLRVEDNSLIVLKLLDTLTLHGCKINCHSTIKVVFILWIWFAYLVNAFYQSSLFSLATNPPRQKQIATESDILHYKLKPCFSEVMQKYEMESTESKHVYTPIAGCKSAYDSINKVLNDQKYYTIFLYGLYQYNKQDFFDIYGHDHIYPFKEAYSKVIYCMYFYKGFPFIHDIRVSSMRLREMGLVDKAMSDMIYFKNIKHHFHAHPYKPRFALPWYLYLFGCTMSAITLVVEIITKHRIG
ncbi:unnamed protein product [Arctia plantaginis]|uniref:Putative ionotropic receptor ligand binding domain-containing protein n=1 Tax=Arctia plantaginis TaxID=874455 RepID=A0A8S1AKV6_ARCPL|nr:unnamed protein product [Arctia plantaginis]